MATFWSAPTTKDAYRLSWISLLFTILAAFAGILLYSVRFVSPSTSASSNLRLTVSSTNLILLATHRPQVLPCV